MFDRLGDVGGDSELRRVLTDDDRELRLMVPVGEAGCVENENAGEGEVYEEVGEVECDDDLLWIGLFDGLEELEQSESTDNRRRTLVCCE